MAEASGLAQGASATPLSVFALQIAFSPTPTLFAERHGNVAVWYSNPLSYASILNWFRHRADFFYFGTTPEYPSKYSKSTWWGRWFVNIFYVQKKAWNLIQAIW